MNKIITLLALTLSGFVYSNYGNQYNSSQYGSTSIHQDPRYMYNYRLGNSGPYTYNYDVEDMNGSGAYGNCNMTGKYGNYTIVNENGDCY